MAVNLDTVYAYAQCLSVHGFCQTREEAETKAQEIKPLQIVKGQDCWEYGYVIEIAPGQLSDNFSQENRGKSDLIFLDDEAHYIFTRPDWMQMGDLPTHS